MVDAEKLLVLTTIVLAMAKVKGGRGLDVGAIGDRPKPFQFSERGRVDCGGGGVAQPEDGWDGLGWHVGVMKMNGQGGRRGGGSW